VAPIHRRGTAEDLAKLPPLFITFGQRPASDEAAPEDEERGVPEPQSEEES
jgi:hypothetical protein